MRLRSLRTSLLALFYAAPWAWLLTFAAFTAAVAVEVGHLPRYGNPDPKSVAGLQHLYLVTAMFLGLAVLSPLIVGLHVASSAVTGAMSSIDRRALLSYGLGAALAISILVGDSLGLRNWLFD